METLVLTTFGLLCVTAFIVKQWSKTSNNNNGITDASKSVKKQESETKESKFKKLQWKFFTAYFLALLGDWLQGPYVYQVS
jgi:hypothetical protein